MKARHLVSIGDLSPQDIQEIIALAREMKAEGPGGCRRPLLAGQSLALLFDKPSLRTRVSFEVAMRHLGGYALYLSPQEVGLGRREGVPDVARVLSRYVDGIVARTYEHRTVEQLAEYATVPVINGLSDLSHPCQALADLLTIHEKRGRWAGLRLAFIGDGGNNVAHSLLLAAAKVGLHMAIACPPGYGPREDYWAQGQEAAQNSGSRLQLCQAPEEAAAGADIVYTDVWTSMGQEAEYERRRALFRPYQVNRRLVALAAPEALVMHDLPARRGEEITDEVLDGSQAVVLDQAENRLHAQKALLALLLG